MNTTTLSPPKPVLPQRLLGRSGIKISQLGLGGLFVSCHGAARDQGIAAVRRALELGVTYIDTAPGYGDSEEILGEALAGHAGPVVLSTKLGGRPSPFLPRDRDCLMRSVEESLRLLRRDRLDMLMIHEPDRPGQYDCWTDYDRAAGPVLDLLQDLKRQGLVKAIGLGGTTVHEMERLAATGLFDVVLTAFNYSLLWREAQAHLLPTLKRLDIGVVVGSPLQQGALAKRYDEQIEHGVKWMSRPRREQFRALYRLLDELELPIAEVALRFILSDPDVGSVLMGSRSVAEVEANVASAAKGPLSPEIMRRLDEIAAMVPCRPFAEPVGLPFAWDYKGPGPG